MSANNESAGFSKKMRELIPYFIMAMLILTVQVGALWLSATEYIPSQPPIGEPEDVINSFYYIIVLVIFSFVIVYLVKKKRTGIIRFIIYMAICGTSFFTISAIFSKITAVTDPILIVSFVLAAALVILLYKFPEWYIVNTAGLLISIGACAIIGVSLSYIPIIVLMVALLIYDFISVYKTKHMITLAHGMMNLKLPILFVIPKKLNYSFIKDDFSDDFSEKSAAESQTDEMKAASESETSGMKAPAESETDDMKVASQSEADEMKTASESETDERDAVSKSKTAYEKAASESKTKYEKTASESKMKYEKAAAGSKTGEHKRKSDALFMGLGDAIIPTLLVVSANRFLTQTVIVADFVAVPALTTMVGTFIGFAVLMYFVSSGKPQAGLPFLNTGAILGFVAGVLLTGTKIVWGF